MLLSGKLNLAVLFYNEKPKGLQVIILLVIPFNLGGVGVEDNYLSISVIKTIFTKNNISKVCSFYRLNTGFTNDIYVVDEKYILKICVNEENEVNFKRECFCYKLYKGIIPVPNVIVSDTSKSIIDKCYMIYEKINGNNLYSRWHLLNNEERKHIVNQLACIINHINTVDYKAFINEFNIDEDINWHKTRYNSLKEKLDKLKSNDVLGDKLLIGIHNYIENNHSVLMEQKIGLTYYDLHFDNVLVSGNKVAALLDFERTDVMSIDYALDTIKRMVQYPYLYASEEYEEFTKQEDYINVLKWFKEFAPEMFDFKDLDTRLSLYSIEYDMHMLAKFPKAEGIKKRLLKTLEY